MYKITWVQSELISLRGREKQISLLWKAATTLSQSCVSGTSE